MPYRASDVVLSHVRGNAGVRTLPLRSSLLLWNGLPPDYRSQFGVTPTSLVVAVSYDVSLETELDVLRDVKISDTRLEPTEVRAPGDPLEGFASRTRAVPPAKRWRELRTYLNLGRLLIYTYCRDCSCIRKTACSLYYWGESIVGEKWPTPRQRCATPDYLLAGGTYSLLRAERTYRGGETYTTLGFEEGAESAARLL